jgi:hypothetical protein
MFERIVAAVAGLVLSLSSAGALAGAHASASLSDLRVQLYAYGSAAPSVTFTVMDGSLARATTYSAAQGGPTEADSIGGTAFAAVGCGSPDSAALGSFAQIAGDPFGGGASVLASAFARFGQAQAEGSASLADGNNFATFTLSPDTLMVISGMADIEAAADRTSLDEYAIGSIDLELSGAQGDSAQSSAAHSVALAGGFAGTFDTRHMLLAITFSNPFDFAIDGSFFGGVDATAVSTVAEPASGGLALMGLAATLLALGRRGARPRVPARNRTSASVRAAPARAPRA